MKQIKKVKFLINKQLMITYFLSYLFIGLGVISFIIGVVYFIPLIFVAILFILTYFSFGERRKFSITLKKIKMYLHSDVEKAFNLLQSEVKNMEPTINIRNEAIVLGIYTNMKHIRRSEKENRRNRRILEKKLAQLIRLRDLIKESLNEKKVFEVSPWDQ